MPEASVPSAFTWYPRHGCLKIAPASERAHTLECLLWRRTFSERRGVCEIQASHFPPKVVLQFLSGGFGAGDVERKSREQGRNPLSFSFPVAPFSPFLGAFSFPVAPNLFVLFCFFGGEGFPLDSTKETRWPWFPMATRDLFFGHRRLRTWSPS